MVSDEIRLQPAGIDAQVSPHDQILLLAPHAIAEVTMEAPWYAMVPQPDLERARDLAERWRVRFGESGQQVDRRPFPKRRWILVVVLAALLGLSAFLILRAAGCFSPRLDVTVTVRNIGSGALGGLSLDQEDGSGHALVPTVAPRATVQVRLVSDDAFGESAIDLVDDATGRNYSLPPGYFENSLHGTIDIEAARASPGAELVGRARCATDYVGGRQGWSKLTR